MPEKEAQLSPEEKLLKVIRDGGDDKLAAPSARPARPEIREETVVDLEAAEVEEAEENLTLGEQGSDAVPLPHRPAMRAKLTLASNREHLIGDGPDEPQEGGAAFAADGSAEDGAEAEAATGPDSAGGAHARRQERRHKPVGSSSMIERVNGVLAALVLVVLAYAGVELWSNLTAGPSKVELKAPPPGAVSDPGAARPAPPDPDSFRAQLKDREFPGFSDAVATNTIDNSGQNQAVPPQSLVVLGIMQSAEQKEAIVLDKTINKMHFISPGDRITVNEKVLELKEIRADGCVFSDGSTFLEVK